ncbi:potassium-transporting ATPase subunit KdpC [Streptomyces sp. NBC_00249]|uniref:potassium-transporting ATPase subunit KdpC n=1 Tax=Streptomyces sp. NBC_00249 TaxID=2975690 RepID=UPI002252369B|nr:potassium-transporting ATPase subunit KdpC [Streptomyces sp. NBC_00249]MCX5196114.1 potassium-transporting ATPase subunit KdpC [Streptomyces sp. NBC_00249]
MNNSVGNTARLLAAGLRALLVLTVLCGVLYPLAVTGVAQAAFPSQANGSEVKDGSGQVVGSALIGQSYGDDPRFFQPRPSAGLGKNSVNTQYELLLSGASNKAADNPDLVKAVEEAKAKVLADNTVPGWTPQPAQVPADAVTSSGSGLDPAISPEYAALQAHRVAARNGLTVAEVERLIAAHTEGRTLGFMGEPRVNVLELNTALRDLTRR